MNNNPDSPIATEKKQIAGVEVPSLMMPLGALVLAGIALYLLSWAAPVLVPVFFALYLTAILAPLYKWLMEKGMKKGLVVLLLITLILGAGIAIFLLALVSVQGLQESLSTYDTALTEEIEAVATELSSDPETVDQISQFVVSLLANSLAVILDVASNFLFSAVLTVFLLLEFDRFMGMATTELSKRPMFAVLPEVTVTAVRYFGIRTRLNLITGVGMTILCVLLDIDYPLLWGVWAFLLSYIPYIGLMMAMIPPALLAWAESGPLYALILVVGVLIINMTIENVLEPSYTGKKLRLSPSIVFVSFFFWGWLLGAMGALLSMPITVMLLLMFSNNESTQWLGNLMGRGDPLPE